ncbi:MAG: VWA domain-containing protein, partial [Deltaproteobacteria bacterium]|nr:VWA domain-containing protein [Deltaproteobacteria bacterium]
MPAWWSATARRTAASACASRSSAPPTRCPTTWRRSRRPSTSWSSRSSVTEGCCDELVVRRHQPHPRVRARVPAHACASRVNLLPTALSWEQVGQLLAVAGLVVTLLYLIRTRRRRVRVPFGPIWTEVLGRKEVSSLWRLLKQIGSWLVAAALVSLLALGAADLRPASEQEEGRSLVLLVDTSASMGATDVPGGRLQLARAFALQEVEQLGPADRATLLSVDEQVVSLVSFSNDPAVLRPAIQQLQASATAADWPRALRFARTALGGRSRGEILLITDAAIPPEVQLPADGPPLRLLLAGPEPGQGGDNAAILAFNVRRYPADRTSYELFLRVKSSFAQPIRCTLRILADDVAAESLPLSLSPGEELIRVFPDLPVLGRKLVARLVFPEGVVDALPLDDEAYALLPEQRKLKVA